ncbi:MAG TPA: CDGSH iron-sulfur domain-containing protein [Thioploca sp.]|nr:CDGSH iron-sulfur domain-containing protein [Thioploca sp.]
MVTSFYNYRKIAMNKPIEMELDANKTYYWCSCGKSEKQPFCDGSHAGTDFKPVEFSPDKTGSAWLCQCKHSKRLPFCDGSHKDL